MVVLGIDPGLATLGFGVVKIEGADINFVDYGCITTPAGIPLPRRLTMIHEDMTALLKEHKPDAVAVEELFFARNVTTALTVGHARGVILITAAECVPDDGLFEYTPMQVKQAVCGYGHADKAQVQHMVRVLLRLDHTPKPDDAADALAVALCHAQTSKMAAQFRIR